MAKFAVSGRFGVPDGAELKELCGKQGIVLELPKGSAMERASRALAIHVPDFTPIYKVRMDGEQKPRYLEETQMERL